MFFWKLWLARTFTAPDAVAVCCDANQPLPFARGNVSDRRAVGRVPLHLAQAPAGGRDDAAGRPARHHRDAAPPQLSRLELLGGHDADAAVLRRRCSSALQPRLFPDEALFDQVVAGTGLDLGDGRLARGARERQLVHADCEPPGGNLSAAIAGGRLATIAGQLVVNPLYRVSHDGALDRAHADVPDAAVRRGVRRVPPLPAGHAHPHAATLTAAGVAAAGLDVETNCGGAACSSTRRRATAERPAAAGATASNGATVWRWRPTHSWITTAGRSASPAPDRNCSARRRRRG